MLGLEYATVLDKLNVNEKEKNSQKSGWEKVYIKSLRLL